MLDLKVYEEMTKKKNMMTMTMKLGFLMRYLCEMKLMMMKLKKKGI